MGGIARGLALAALLALAAPASAGDAWFEAGRAAVASARAHEDPQARARNVILFVGDGMGVSTVTAARILDGQLRGEPGEENLLSFEHLPHLALVKTYNSNQQTPDSAGTMTAMLTGSKTRAGVIGLDDTVPRGDHAQVAGHRLTNLFDLAEERGLATGVVTTTRVTHATPAACYAHSPERSWEDDSNLSEAARADDFPDFARQLVEYPLGDGLDVVLGGGRAQFLPEAAGGRRRDGRDLTAEWLARRPGASYVTRASQLARVDPNATRQLLGLFADSHMHYAYDRVEQDVDEPSLEQMTESAIAILSRHPRGYVLVVEGGRIDHAHHQGNAFRALTDTIAFARAVGRALELVDTSETLVIVTADHSHVFTIAGYPTRGNPILGKVLLNDERGEPNGELARDVLGLPYTTLGYHNGAGYVESLGDDEYHFERVPGATVPLLRGRPDLTHVDTTHPDYLQEAAVPTHAETHSAEDVAVYAGGPGAALVRGVMEQNVLFHVMAEALGWSRPEPWWKRILP